MKWFILGFLFLFIELLNYYVLLIYILVISEIVLKGEFDLKEILILELPKGSNELSDILFLFITLLPTFNLY